LVLLRKRGQELDGDNSRFLDSGSVLKGHANSFIHLCSVEREGDLMIRRSKPVILGDPRLAQMDASDPSDRLSGKNAKGKRRHLCSSQYQRRVFE
jgi:hypothetical protein